MCDKADPYQLNVKIITHTNNKFKTFIAVIYTVSIYEVIILIWIRDSIRIVVRLSRCVEQCVFIRLR